EEKEEEEKEIILSYKFTNEELNVSPQQFLNVIQQVNQAIKNKQLPRRIHQGSSGSYFCVDKDGNNLGVFKPKDEEPYGQLNPKWTKWLHRNLFPCCFGRSSLIPNLGYLSESSASIVDRSLNLGLVPRTEVVKLSSPSFHYRYKDKRTTKLPLKIGSFQLFLNNYMNGTEFLEKYPFPKNNNDSDHFLSTDGILKNDIHSMNHFWTFKRKLYFRLELEKLIVLDYLIRNTDRSSDNWMIKVLGNEEIRIAAIDHGLAFPHKHPDKWRSYPYGWLSLPIEIIGKPFHKITRAYLLPILTSIEFWDQLEHQLLKLNKIDNDFNLKMFQKQMQVIKGQGFNLLQSLLNSNDGPIQLCNRKNKVVEE
ncbi:phosphatidylinositol 3 and 4-kinase, partial [Neoconidiobolus thromboides FSU 785]